MNTGSMFTQSAQSSALEINKVLRQTYMLLAMSLAFSAVCAGVAMIVGVGPGVSLLMTIAAFVTLFVVHKNANNASGIYWVFAFTGLMGASLGYTLQMYLNIGGPGLIMQALGGTAVAFFALSAYALSSKKDFNFLGGFLIVGLLVAVVAGIANIFLQIPAMSLATSAVIVLIMSGFILFDTSRIVHGGETNYIRATVSLYLNIYNLFIHMLHLLAAFSGRDD